jgi:hypothetical protein
MFKDYQVFLRQKLDAKLVEWINLGMKNTISKYLNKNRIHLDDLKKDHYHPIDQFNNDDVFIVGFPKSGNTWMQNLISGLLFGIDTRFLPDRLAQELIPDLHSKKIYKRILPISCFKTHDLPKSHYKKVIHIVRDGRDAMVSYFAMNKALGLDVTLDEMVIEGKNVFPCKWYKFIEKWQENPFGAQILQIKYEDLIYDPLVQLKSISEFIGVRRPIEILEKCVVGSSFDQMRAKEMEYGYNNTKWNKNEKFIRKGKIGSFKDEMSESLQTSFLQEAHSQLKTCGYI